MHVFLDESGDFYNDEYFIVGGFLTGNQKRTAKVFRKWQHHKFPKKIRAKTEVKFDDSGLGDTLRLKTLAQFTKQDIRIFYTFLNRKNIPTEFRTKRGIESGYLYTEVVSQTLSQLFPSAETDLNILIDQRHLKKISKSEFRETVRLHLLPQAAKGSRIYVDTGDSTTNPNIQIADWVCGALFRFYTGRRFGTQFYDTLKNSTIASAELFKDFWAESHNKKTPPER